MRGEGKERERGDIEYERETVRRGEREEMERSRREGETVKRVRADMREWEER